MEDNKIFMEQEEYEAYLAAQKQIREARQKETDKQIEAAKKESSDAGINLYEMNRMIIAQNFPHADQEKLNKFYEERFIPWRHMDHNRGIYFMLLNHELHYYTVFIDNDNTDDNTDMFWKELLELFEYIGPIRDIHIDDNGALAIWADWHNDEVVTNLPHCFYLFNYNKGVVKIG